MIWISPPEITFGSKIFHFLKESLCLCIYMMRASFRFQISSTCSDFHLWDILVSRGHLFIMSSWPRATISQLCTKTIHITSVRLSVHCWADIVHCEPAAVIDINNTNLEIDFVADKPSETSQQSERSEGGPQAESPTKKEEAPPPVTYSSAAFNREKRLAFFNKKHSAVC